MMGKQWLRNLVNLVMRGNNNWEVDTTYAGERRSGSQGYGAHDGGENTSQVVYDGGRTVGECRKLMMEKQWLGSWGH